MCMRCLLFQTNDKQVKGLSVAQIRRLGSSSGGGTAAAAAAAAAPPAIPVWVMHGDADGVLPLAGAEALHEALGEAAAAQGPLRRLAGASHNFIVERPAAVVGLLKEAAGL